MSNKEHEYIKTLANAAKELNSSFLDMVNEKIATLKPLKISPAAIEINIKLATANATKADESYDLVYDTNLNNGLSGPR